MAARKRNEESARALAQAQRIRAGATLVEVFNSGLEVWLYDASHRAALKSSGAFETDVDDAVMIEKMETFVKSGSIMAYGLAEDNSLNIAVAVGAPLSRKERVSARWLKPQQGFLRLPTGRLVIESNDALTIRKEKPTDRGAELAVPPGDYLATLHRIDWDALEADEIEWDGPHEFITLTPGPKAKPVRNQPAFLPWEPAGPGKAKWTVQGGVYRGSVQFHDASTAMSVALDAKGAGQLGLHDCCVALLSVPDLKLECPLVFLAGDARKYEFFARVEKVRVPREYAGREWAHAWMQPDMDAMFCMRVNPRVVVPKKQHNVWHPATIQVVKAGPK